MIEQKDYVTRNEFEKLIGIIATSFTDTNNQISALAARTEEIFRETNRRMEEGFRETNRRMDEGFKWVDERFDRLESIVSNHEVRIKALERKKEFRLLEA